MDIRKWLSEIVQPECTSKQSPEPIRSKHVDSAPRRKHPVHDTSDSSLLDFPCRKISILPNECNHPTDQNADEHAESDDSRSTSASINNSPQRYARKRRYKTRPERYEPLHKVTGQPDKSAHYDKLDESNKSRRKYKRKKAEKLGSGAIPDFNAKNVYKDRLTLKLSESLGLFNKGKTSVRTKGHGLPDLVFSEMAFLKKSRDRSGTLTHAATSNKKQKRDHGHNKEEEISSFFTSVRPTLADLNGKSHVTADFQFSNNSTPHTSLNCKQARKRVRERNLEKSLMINEVVPTIEKHGRAQCVGSGSKGSSHESTSQVSWSESHHSLSKMPPGYPRAVPTVDGGQPDSTKASRGTVDKERLLYPTSVSNQHRAAELLRVPSVHSARSNLAKPQSSPISSPQRRSFDSKDGRRRIVDNDALSAKALSGLPARSSVDTQSGKTIGTPKILETRPGFSVDFQTTSIHKRHVSSGETESAEIYVQSPFNLGSVLRECVDAVHAQHCANVSPRKKGMQSVRFGPIHEETLQDVTESDYMTQGDVDVRLSELNIPTSRTPNFAGPSIYELQEQHSRVGNKANWHPDCLEQSYVGDLGDSDENDFGIEDLEGLPEEPVLYDAMNDARGRGGEYEVNSGIVAQKVARLAVLDNNIGTCRFWRPNKLY